MQITPREEPWSKVRKMCRIPHIGAGVALLLVLLLGGPLLAWAHIDQPLALSLDQPWQHVGQPPQPLMPAAHPASSAMLGMPLTFMLFVLLAVAMMQGMWRWRRTAALGLVLVLGTFTFGIAVHSVHHLSDPAKAAECPVFSASQHLSGTLAEPSYVYAPVLAISTAPCSTGDVQIPTCSFRSDLPRAPPSLPV